MSGIEMMVKGNFEERSKLLFKFYDFEGSGGVSYDELLKMVHIKWYSFTVIQNRI